MNDEMQDLFRAALRPQTLREQARFFRDLLTDDELRMLAQRWRVAEEIWKTKDSYQQIAERVQTSTATVNRVASKVRFGEGGFEHALKNLYPKIPNEDELENSEREKEDRRRKKHGHRYAKRGFL